MKSIHLLRYLCTLHNSHRNSRILFLYYPALQDVPAHEEHSFDSAHRRYRNYLDTQLNTSHYEEHNCFRMISMLPAMVKSKIRNIASNLQIVQLRHLSHLCSKNYIQKCIQIYHLQF